MSNNNQDEYVIKGILNDLAFAVNSLTEFSGSETDDVVKWIENLHLICNVFQLQGNDIRKLVVSKL